MKSDIDQGIAKKIVKIYKGGNLIDEDDNVLKTEEFPHGSLRVIPSLANIKMGSGSRADIYEAHNFANGTWTLEIVRKRDTGDTEDDVQFTKRGFLLSLLHQHHGQRPLPTRRRMVFWEPPTN